MKCAQNILQLIGNTPLVRINKITENLNCSIYAKLESFNPLSSVKDRLGMALIEDGEKAGKISKDTVIIEPTSGNTGIGLAYVCAVKGYKLILTMPETMSIERRKLLQMLGAEIVLTIGDKGMKGAIEKASEIAAKIGNAYIPQQFENPANPEIHKKTTAKEIWDDTEGKIDIFVAGVGTGGTITGVGEFLKSKNPEIKIIAVEPASSAVLSGGCIGPHRIQGIGAGFIPKVYNKDIVDRIIPVSDENAISMAKKLAKEEGILVGISSGAAMWAALEIGKKAENSGKNIVTIFPDSGERYVSTLLFDSV
ncbi:cysteine synthase A [Candidatus Margulisiibacteriota bacterium]